MTTLGDVKKTLTDIEIYFYKHMEDICTVVNELQAVCYEIPRRFMCYTDAKTLALYCDMIKQGERF